MQIFDIGPPEQNIADKVYASSAAESENKDPPHSNIGLHANAAAAQLELTVQMVANLSSSASTTPIALPRNCLGST